MVGIEQRLGICQHLGFMGIATAFESSDDLPITIGQSDARADLKSGESVLYRLVGDPSVMRAQLTQLAKASALPAVKLQVLTWDSGGPAGVGGFTCLEFAAEGKLPETAALLLDGRVGPARVDDPDEAWRYARAFDYLWEPASQPGPAISRALAEAWA